MKEIKEILISLENHELNAEDAYLMIVESFSKALKNDGEKAELKKQLKMEVLRAKRGDLR